MVSLRVFPRSDADLMRVIAAVQADLEVTPIGTKSRLGMELRGVPVLRRTVERMGKIRSIDGVFVLCPAAQAAACERLVNGTGAAVGPHDAGPAPWSALVRSARKWSLDAWRGGIGGTTVYDEYTDARVLAVLAREQKADAVWVIPPGAAVVDPALNEALIQRRMTVGEDVRLTFTPTPPGLSGILLDSSLIAELVEKNIPVGWLFSYQPDSPRKDLIFQDCCLETPAPIRFAGGRLIADTERAMRRLADLLAEHPDPDAATACRWLIERENTVDPLPHEVEIELTTDDPYPDAVLCPRGARVPRRGPMTVEFIKQIAEELARFDDSLVVLGGFGDPLRHPRFADVLRILRAAGTYGLCVRTAGVDLTDDHISSLLDHGVDVLSVGLDAWSAELYAGLKSPNGPSHADLGAVTSRLDRLARERERRRSACPIVVPEMIKARDNVHELDEFHDGWLRKVGAVSITGVSRFAGQTEDRSLIDMAPKPRTACRRIHSRFLVLADATVVACDQDFRGTLPLGRFDGSSLSAIWQGQGFASLRSDHSAGHFSCNPLCDRCGDWHRP